MMFSGVFTVVLFLCANNFVVGWDSDDLELFDLVEEVGRNFYDVIGVTQSVDSADLKRAYRKLSLQLHPDKNKEPDAEIQFRQLVAVHDVLKNPTKRAKYDEVLVNGLPDWRQPVYYYRRVRKMGLFEFSILLSIILTTGHIIVMWSIYFERRFEKQEVFRAKKKRDKKGRQTLDEDKLEAELNTIQRPQLADVLPCILVRFVTRLIVSLPSVVVLLTETYRDWRSTKDTDSDDESLDVGTVRTIRKRPSPNVDTLPGEYEKNLNKNATEDIQDAISNLAEQLEQSQPKEHGQGDMEWSEQDLALLAKAVARYPGGVPDRWEKISQMVGRSVKEVTAMSRQVKAKVSRSVDPSVQGITASALPDTTNTLPQDVTHGDWDSELQQQASPDTRHHSKPAPKTVERTLMISQPSEASPKPAVETVKGSWTQMQQKQLETALSQVPKTAADRWDQIAKLVSEKTKEECIQRYKYLADVVKKRKEMSNN